jgi:hypothetical protein
MDKWKIKPRNTHAEWKMLNKYFGNEEMSLIFRDFSAYNLLRKDNTYQEIFNEVESLMNTQFKYD